mgnify:CR=1 FL=1
MKYASEDLIKEHEGILFGLKILEKMVQLLKEKNQFQMDELKEMINFLRLFADKCHHGKEEGLLFPALENAGIPRENGPIEQMLLEHMEGRKYIAQMTELSESTAFDKTAFIQSATNYIQLLRAHIDKENTILFPLGDKRIPLEKQTELLEAFEEHEVKVMGIGTHEKLHALLHRFKRKYLSK